ncbi:hypothetical protein D3C80_803260 [compost metagenome]
MLQYRQLQQGRQVTHQLHGNDQHQDGDQYRTQGDWMRGFHAVDRRRHVPQGDVFQEGEGRVNF